MPRQSPQKPPNPEMKSIQVIFCDLSNSEGNLIQGLESFIYQTLKSHQKRYSQLQYHFCRHRSTHFPGRSTSQRKKVNYRNSTFLFLWWAILTEPYLGEWWYHFSFTHRVWVLLSHRPSLFVDIFSLLVPVSLLNAWLPHCQRCEARVTKRAQVQVPWITWSRYFNNNNKGSCTYYVITFGGPERPLPPM